MSQLQRIAIILSELRENKHTADSLKLFINSKMAAVSLRQIQRDLKELPLFLHENELISTAKENKTIFYTILKKPHTALKTKQDTSFLYTKFYTQITSNNILKKLNTLELAIIENKTILIQTIKNDQTVDNSEFETKNFELHPIHIIYHRDNYYIGGWNPKKEKVQLFGLSQLVHILVLNKTFDPTVSSIYFNDEFKKRFGVTKNINDEVYDIALEIPEVLASFIKNNHWHDSQRFSVKNSKTIMHLKCGINRELMGWLFQWMYNIRIIKPPILIDYYQKTIDEIQKNCKSNKPLVYRNIFETKEE